MKKRKIFFVLTPAFNPNDGGVQRTTYKLGKHFTENDYEVIYFSTSKTGHINVEFGQLFHAEYPGGCSNKKNILKLTLVLKKVKPDIVINQMPYEYNLRYTLSSYKKELNYKLIGCLRNSLFSFKSNVKEILKNNIGNKAFFFMNNPLIINTVLLYHKIKHSNNLKSIIDLHDYFILLAPPNKEELIYFVGDYKKEKVIWIPNSIPEIHESNSKENIILHVGRIELNQKRSDLLIDFWSRLHLRIPEWKFVIIGDGPYFETLSKNIKSLGLTGVELKGFQKPKEFYKRSKIFMMPSAYEGFPNTILEAQSYGCIPFAFNSYAALEWIVNDCDDAFLSPAFDVQDMADKLICLISNEEKLKKISKNALKNAEQFTIGKVGNYWFDLFDKII